MRTRFEELVQRCEPPLLRFLFGLVQDREQAADLCQETFLAAYRALPRLSPDAQLDAWLYTIALNAARMSLRRQRLLRWVSFLPGLHDRAASGTDLATRVVERDQLSAVLRELPAEQRACLLLHADGFRYVEIAQILDCSLSAVKVRIFRARRRCLALYEAASEQSHDEEHA
jgi:RNA polymerase sigma-70 factor, ECF subfamily